MSWFYRSVFPAPSSQEEDHCSGNSCSCPKRRAAAGREDDSHSSDRGSRSQSSRPSLCGPAKHVMYSVLGTRNSWARECTVCLVGGAVNKCHSELRGDVIASWGGTRESDIASSVPTDSPHTVILITYLGSAPAAVAPRRKMIGVAFIAIHDGGLERCGRQMTLSNLCVHPDYRGCGFGSKILCHLGRGVGLKVFECGTIVGQVSQNRSTTARLHQIYGKFGARESDVGGYIFIGGSFVTGQHRRGVGLTLSQQVAK